MPTKKITLAQEAMELRKRFDELSSYIYFSNFVKNKDDFDKFIKICRAGYTVVNPARNIMFTIEPCFSYDLNRYFREFPSKLDDLRKLKGEVKEFLVKVKNRCPHLFKTGNFGMHINVIVNLEQIKKTIIDGKYFLSKNNLPLEVTNNIGRYNLVHYTRLDDLIVNNLSGEITVKPYEDLIKDLQEKQAKTSLDKLEDLQVENNSSENSVKAVK